MKVGSFLLGSTFALTPIAINMGLAAVNAPVALSLPLAAILEYYCGKEEGLNNIARKLGLKKEELFSLDNFLQKTFKKSVLSSSKKFYKKYKESEYSNRVLFGEKTKNVILEYISLVDYSKKIDNETLSCVFNESSDYIKLEKTINIIAGIDFNKYTKDLSSENKNNILVEYFKLLRLSLSHNLLSDSDKYKQFINIQNQILNERLDTIEEAIRNNNNSKIRLSKNEKKYLLNKLGNKELFSNSIDEYLREQSNKYQNIINILDSHTDKLDQITADVSLVKEALVKKKSITYFLDKCNSFFLIIHANINEISLKKIDVNKCISYLWTRKFIKLLLGLFLVLGLTIVAGGFLRLDPGLEIIYITCCKSLGFNKYALKMGRLCSEDSHRNAAIYARAYYFYCYKSDLDNNKDISYVNKLYDEAILGGYDLARINKGILLYHIGEIDSAINCFSEPINYNLYKPVSFFENICYLFDKLIYKNWRDVIMKEYLFLCYNNKECLWKNYTIIE